MGRSARVGAAVVAGAMLLTACEAAVGGNSRDGGRLEVVASFYPLAEAARQVGGERVAVANLTPTGAEPHDLELSPRQTRQVLEADLAVVMGRGFQPAVEEAARRRRAPTLRVLGELSLPPAGSTGGEHGGGRDPHVWLDPVLMGEVVDEVAAALSRADPAHQDGYLARADAYAARLERLDAAYDRALTGCRRRVLVTSHEAFGWLAERYGLRERAIAGLSPEAEPDPRRLARLARLVSRTGTTTVYTETLVSPEVAQSLAREAGVDTAVLNPLEGLTDEQLARGDDYLTVMRDNLRLLERSLGCG
ncbi:MAG: zinc ABC transporter substrate-binding protein [Actinomycetota bacterium]|nr:zinc ABC transporter substrate-binding protein [Actinomycetota bacterium]